MLHFLPFSSIRPIISIYAIITIERANPANRESLCQCQALSGWACEGGQSAMGAGCVADFRLLCFAAQIFHLFILMLMPYTFVSLRLFRS